MIMKLDVYLCLFLEIVCITAADINECKLAGVTCGANTVCRNVIGSYICACANGYTGDPYTKCNRNCSATLDLVFLIDGSGSIQPDEFKSVLDLVVNISSKFEMKYFAKIGVIQYSAYQGWINNGSLIGQPYITTEVTIGQFDNIRDFRRAVRNISLQARRTDTARAIRKAALDFMASPRFNDSTTKKILILVTDGNANDGYLLEDSSNYIRSLGVVVYAVGFDGYVEDELKVITGTAKNTSQNEFIYGLADFSSLNGIIDDLQQAIEGVAGCKPIVISCGENTIRTNISGNVSCSCLSGYSGDPYNQCDDVNECDSMTIPCGANATCNNAVGSYTCACLSGYTGDPYVGCNDINECQDSMNICNTSGLNCINTPGSFLCECETGFYWNRTLCMDVNECDSMTIPCGANATCNNAVGSYTCACLSGYTGDPYVGCNGSASLGAVCSVSPIIRPTYDQLMKLGLQPGEQFVVSPHLILNRSTVDPACVSGVNRSVLQIKLTACGAIIQENNNHLEVTYTIRNLPTVISTGPIERLVGHRYNITCSFPTNSLLYSSVIFPLIRKYSADPVWLTGKLDIGIDYFTDELFKETLPENSVVFALNYIYVGISFEKQLDSRLILQATSCWATPTPNPNEVNRYPIIKKSCPAVNSFEEPGSIEVLKNYQSGSIYLKFKAFIWKNINSQDQAIYVHCSVGICYNNSANTCDNLACPMKRKRRDTHNVEQKIISSKPMYVQYRERDCAENNGGCSDHCQMVQDDVVCSCDVGRKILHDGKTCQTINTLNADVVNFVSNNKEINEVEEEMMFTREAFIIAVAVLVTGGLFIVYFTLRNICKPMSG